ncbi:MAG: HD domain-containing protein [Oscillospiraceae bacterium]
MNIVLPAQVKTAIDMLEQQGFDAFIVGGCVRDSVLKVAPPDWDITTSALPEEILTVFKDFKTIKTGIKHGTVTVIINEMPLEITTFRIDGNYLDNRHPQSVEFCCSLNEDLSRRDFTINSMAFNESSGLIDILGGLNDIDRKIIKCVGNPDERFCEDALRILRALRFSSVLGFDLEQSTSDSILRNDHLLQNVSKERIGCELLKLLCGKNVVNVLLKYRKVFAKIIPEIEPMFDFDQKNKHHIFDVWEHTVYAIGFSEADPIVRLTLLLHDIGKPRCYTVDNNGVGHFYGHGNFSADIANTVLKNLRLSNEMSATILTLVKYHDYDISADEKVIKMMLTKFTLPVLNLLFKVQTADSLAHNPVYSGYTEKIQEAKIMADEIVERDECFSLKKLNINGNDLIDIGITDGKKIGEILNLLLIEVIDTEVCNDKASLITRAKDIFGGNTNG